LALDVLWANEKRGNKLTIDRGIAAAGLTNLIRRSAPVGHGNEVLWSLWAAMLLQIRLDDDLLKDIGDLDDSFVAIAAFRAAERGVFGSIPESNLWKGWLKEKWFDSSHWLFIYEAFRNGWFAEQRRGANLLSNDCIKFLYEHGVGFSSFEALDSYSPMYRYEPSAFHGDYWQN
jgi:hypothetical protein